MRFSLPYQAGAVTLLALTLGTGCSGSSDSQSTANDPNSNRVGTSIDKNGNSIFNGERDVKPETKPSKRGSSPSNTAATDVTAMAAADTDTDTLDDGTADVAVGDLPEATADDMQQDAVVATPSQNTEVRAAQEKALQEQRAAEEARKKQEAELAAKNAAAEKRRKLAATKRDKQRQADAMRRAKTNKKAIKARERAQKETAAAEKERKDNARSEAEVAREAARLKLEAAQLAQQMADAKAAAEAIRRAEAEAAAKQETERQAKEMARVGEGLNKECPYITLEAAATEGALTTDNINCLDSSIHKAELGADRANVSMVLLTNARAKGDIEGWEKRMEYHLLKIERDNPALAYRYALHLFEKGPGESQATYRWTGVALQSRSAWAGELYTERVNAIYKLRAAAAQSLWKQAIEALASFPGAENEARVKTQRHLTRSVAKEWYEFAMTHEQDSLMALQLCNIASVDPSFCQADETSDAQ
jgi:hypothetical protein